MELRGEIYVNVASKTCLSKLTVFISGNIHYIAVRSRTYTSVGSNLNEVFNILLQSSQNSHSRVDSDILSSGN